MAKYLYNGVELNEIPKVDGRDYALIVDADGVYCVERTNSKNEVYNTGHAALTAGDGLFKYVDGQWVSTYWTSFPGSYTVIWANYDLYYKTVDSYGDLSGTLYLAASEPVPVQEFKVKKFPLRQFILGILSELTAGSAREPVAYLYNGVRLPKLPEWDNVAYPYAVMSMLKKDSTIIKTGDVYLCASPYLISFDGSNLVMVDAPERTDYLVYQCLLSDGATEFTLVEHLGNDADNIVIFLSDEDAFWSNVDILSEDGEIYLAASEPVPVYE